MHPALTRVEHRPWQVPERRWTWRQSWCDLLFAHWPISVAAVRHLVPPELEIDEFDGTSWIGIVPFRMEGVSPRPLPDLPWLSAFPELNVRLYVTHQGKPGVWFLSLDATNRLAIWGAKMFFHLPYFHADMRVDVTDREVHYRSVRTPRYGGNRFQATYQPVSSPHESQPGTLEHFLTERYCLYSQSPSGAIYRCEVHHHPWPLQRAEGEIEVNELFRGFVDLPPAPPTLLHFARRLDVVVWPLERC
ncbi:MAG: YqjF family protein [Planctomycetaceae bacterium]